MQRSKGRTVGNLATQSVNQVVVNVNSSGVG